MEKSHWMNILLNILLVMTFCYKQTYGQSDFTYMPNNPTTICNASNPISLKESQEFSAQSALSCAAICLSKNLQVYKYQDGMCIPVGNESSSAQTTGVQSSGFSRHSVQEVAFQKPSDSVPYWTSPYNLVSGLAVDGNEVNYFHSHPSSPTYPWWFVDLGRIYIIKAVHILANGNTASHSSNFVQIEVRAGNTRRTDGDFTSYTLIDTYPGPATYGGPYIEFVPTHFVCGQYISVQKMVTAPAIWMAYNEVKVFAYVPA